MFNLNFTICLTINAPAETPELQHLATNISQLTNSQLIAGISPRETRELVPVDQIIRIHTDAKHVVMETKATSYTLTQRIYQLKQLLPSDLFLQLSSGELVNRQHIRHFSLTPSGLYQVLLSTGATTFVSRRCMQQIRKEFLK